MAIKNALKFDLSSKPLVTKAPLCRVLNSYNKNINAKIQINYKEKGKIH